MSDVTLARLSHLIYEPDSPYGWTQLRKNLKIQDIELVEFRDHAEAQVMLAFFSGKYAVVFRGTEASRARWRDLKDNFGFPTVWAGEGRAHSGYLAALNRVRFTARTWLESIPSRTPVFVTGHSMGGALATLFASWYFTEYPGDKLAGLVTFGAPKALSKVAGERIACPMTRYVIPMDFAPSWPPVLGLEHPCPETRLEAPYWWPGPVSRHSPKGYVEAVSAHLG